MNNDFLENEGNMEREYNNDDIQNDNEFIDEQKRLEEEQQELLKKQLEASINIEFLDDKFIITTFHSIHITIHSLISKIIYKKYLDLKSKIDVSSYFELNEREIKMLQPIISYFVKSYISKYYPFIAFLTTYGSITINQYMTLRKHLIKNYKKLVKENNNKNSEINEENNQDFNNEINPED